MSVDTPSSAPLYVKRSQQFDEIAGFPSRETGVDPLIRAPGSNQFLGHQAAHHDGEPDVIPDQGNRLLPGTLPQVSGPAIGAPNHVNPLGARSSASISGD
jgi:hypothetical protein